MSDFPPLLLAFGVDDLLKYLAPFVFLIIWVVSQIMEAKKKGAPPLAKQQPVNPPPPLEQQRPQQPAGQLQAAGAPAGDSLREQVDEFLRRAGRGEKPQGPRPPKQRPRPAAPSEIEILLDEEVAAPRRERLAQPLRPMDRGAAAQSPEAPKPGPPMPAPRREPSVDRAAEQIGAGARDVAFKPSRLGQRIVQDDAQFDIELQSRFDHQVGTLGGRSTAPAAEVPAAASAAAQLAELLSSPQGMRQAIVLNEILRRPVDRW